MDKPKGISKEEYAKYHAGKSDEDFKYDTIQMLNFLKDSHRKLDNKIDKTDGLVESNRVEVGIEINEVMQSTMNSLKEFRSTLGDIKTGFDKDKETMRGFENKLSLCVTISDYKETIADLYKITEKLHSKNASMVKEYNDLIERLKVDFKTSLNQMKEDILSRPSEIPELRKLIDQKIELVELNGQNAVLRSSNNENKIMLLERKIENLYQLIKKLENSQEK